mmetsp:Transcript_35575/g.110429  ORF Transcript_35575/g.110429 Transcript_35575/m.110429 type:complete len:248 (-) Transcript_35575:392-1135(-)
MPRTTCPHPSTSSACRSWGRRTSPTDLGLPRGTSRRRSRTTTRRPFRPPLLSTSPMALDLPPVSQLAKQWLHWALASRQPALQPHQLWRVPHQAAGPHRPWPLRRGPRGRAPPICCAASPRVLGLQGLDPERSGHRFHGSALRHPLGSGNCHLQIPAPPRHRSLALGAAAEVAAPLGPSQRSPRAVARRPAAAAVQRRRSKAALSRTSAAHCRRGAWRCRLPPGWPPPGQQQPRQWVSGRPGGCRGS